MGTEYCIRHEYHVTNLGNSLCTKAVRSPRVYLRDCTFFPFLIEIAMVVPIAVRLAQANRARAFHSSTSTSSMKGYVLRWLLFQTVALSLTTTTALLREGSYTVRIECPTINDCFRPTTANDSGGRFAALCLRHLEVIQLTGYNNSRTEVHTFSTLITHYYIVPWRPLPTP